MGKHITHRDIKPDNILVNMKARKVVIADLGSAKVVTDGSYNKAYICSRIYRAPELVAGCEHYTNKVDVWSAACVMVEIMIRAPLFSAQSNKHLFNLMQKMFGGLKQRKQGGLKLEERLKESPYCIQNVAWMKF